MLSGGNIDLPLIQAVVRRGLTVSGRYLVLSTRIPDRPGALMQLLQVLAENRVNIVDIVHHREGLDVFVTDTEVELTVETRDAAHAGEVLELLAERGFAAERAALIRARGRARSRAAAPRWCPRRSRGSSGRGRSG